MLVFPNCKINLGLHVLSKRGDGFHDLETIFYPITWCDALEVIENKATTNAFVYSQSGIKIEGSSEDNLIYKAWEIINGQKKLPPLMVHLHKNIPMGAGLGGGSSDAAHFINLLNSKFELNYNTSEKRDIASRLGSDCAFFIENEASFATGKGNDFSDIQLDLSSYFILIVYPNIHSNTKAAYETLTPDATQGSLHSIITSTSVKDWRNTLKNNFEVSVFKKYPAIKLLKKNLYKMGALYASMSGSGSAVFGIFEKEPEINFKSDVLYYLQKPLSKIL